MKIDIEEIEIELLTPTERKFTNTMKVNLIISEQMVQKLKEGYRINMAGCSINYQMHQVSINLNAQYMN